MSTNPYDKVLEQKGLKYEDLTQEEKDLYVKAGNSTRAIGVSDLEDHVDKMLYDVLMELVETPDTPDFQDKNNKLKARLKVYAVLQAFLKVPEKVAKAIEREAEENAG